MRVAVNNPPTIWGWSAPARICTTPELVLVLAGSRVDTAITSLSTGDTAMGFGSSWVPKNGAVGRRMRYCSLIAGSVSLATSPLPLRPT